MADEFGTEASSVLAVIGPSISLESFQVWLEVVDRFMDVGIPSSVVVDMGPREAGSMVGGLHIDLWEANRWLLVSAGVHPARIVIGAGMGTLL